MLVTRSFTCLAVGLGIACSTSSGGVHPGTDAGGSGPDATLDAETDDASDGGGEVETGVTTPNATVYLVDAVVDPMAPPAFRFCFGIQSAADGGGVIVSGGFDAFPDGKMTAAAPVAGLLAGYGASTASSAQLQTFDLGTLNLVVYALDAAAAAVASDTVEAGPDGGDEAPCEYLIGSDGEGATSTSDPTPYKGVLTEGTGYWQVGTIAQGQIADGTTWLAALTGCVPGEGTAAATLCGAGYDSATGNLALRLSKLDSTTDPDGGVGAQLAHVSPAWDSVTAAFGGSTTAAGFTTPVLDGGVGGDAGAVPPTFHAIETTATFGSLLPATLATVPGVTFDGGSSFLAESLSSTGAPLQGPPNPQDGGPCTAGVDCVAPMWMALPDIPGATGDPGGGGGLVFVLVGDPTAAPGPYVDTASGQACTRGSSPTCVLNGRFVHFLAFPTR